MLWSLGLVPLAVVAISVPVVLLLNTRGSRRAAKVSAILSLLLTIAANIYLATAAWSGGASLLVELVPTVLTLMVVRAAMVSPQKADVGALVAGVILALASVTFFFSVGIFYAPAALAVFLSLACWPRQPITKWR